MSNYLEDGYYSDRSVASAPVDERVSFIRKVYLHLAVSVAGLVGIMTAMKMAHLDEQYLQMFVRNPLSLLVLMVFFIGASYVANYMARGDMPIGVKYAGLALYTVVEALILTPIVYVAEQRYTFAIVEQAALLTLIVFAGLTLTVFVTKKDFSFLGHGLMLLSWLMFGLIILSLVGPFIGISIGLGMWFSALGIALGAGYILYNTSNIMHHYPTTEYVGAALELLSDVVLMFYYILRLLMQMKSE